MVTTSKSFASLITLFPALFVGLVLAASGPVADLTQPIVTLSLDASINYAPLTAWSTTNRSVGSSGFFKIVSAAPDDDASLAIVIWRTPGNPSFLSL